MSKDLIQFVILSLSKDLNPCFLLLRIRGSLETPRDDGTYNQSSCCTIGPRGAIANSALCGRISTTSSCCTIGPRRAKANSELCRNISSAFPAFSTILNFSHKLTSLNISLNLVGFSLQKPTYKQTLGYIFRKIRFFFELPLEMRSYLYYYINTEFASLFLDA